MRTFQGIWRTLSNKRYGSKIREITVSSCSATIVFSEQMLWLKSASSTCPYVHAVKKQWIIIHNLFVIDNDSMSKFNYVCITPLNTNKASYASYALQYMTLNFDMWVVRNQLLTSLFGLLMRMNEWYKLYQYINVLSIFQGLAKDITTMVS